MSAILNVGAFRNLSAYGSETFISDLNVSQAMDQVGMLYQVHKVPLIAKSKKHKIKLTIPNRYALVMEQNSFSHTPTVLNVVGPRYQVLQNKDIAQVLDGLTEFWPTETVGVCRNGKTVFVTLKMEDYTIGGNDDELHQTYLLVADNKGTMQSAVWAIVHVRVVCSNTYQLALSSASELIRILHTQDPRLQLNLRRDLVDTAIQARTENIETMDALFQRPADNLMIEHVLDATFPVPPIPSAIKVAAIVPDSMITVAALDARSRATSARKSYELTQLKIRAHRRSVRGRLGAFNDNHPYAANTLYAIIQAITEEFNHSDLFVGDEKKQAISIMFGSRNDAMKRAINAAQSLL